MKTGFLKPFLSAVAGSALLLITLLVVAGMRPEATVAQASPMQNDASLASTTAPTVTLAVVEEPNLCMKEATLMVTTGEANTTDVVTAHVVVADKGVALDPGSVPSGEVSDSEMSTYLAAWDEDYTVITVTIPVNQTSVEATYEVSADYPEHIGAVASIYSKTDTTTGTVITSEPAKITVNPCIAFDSSVKDTVNFGDVWDVTMKVMPEVDVYNQTKESILMNYGDGSDAVSVVLSDTNVFTKDGKPNATYVYTDSDDMGLNYEYALPGMYTVTAQYESGVPYYSGMVAEATKQITVVAPGIDFMVQDADGNDVDEVDGGATVYLKANITWAVSSVMKFCATPWGGNKETLHYTDLVSTTDAMYEYTLPKVTETTVYTLDAKLINNRQDEATIVKAEPITITVNPGDELYMDIDPAVDTTVKTGETVTVTATLYSDANKTQIVSDTQVSFTKEGVGEFTSATTPKTDEAGKASVTVTSAATGTMTVMAEATMGSATVSDTVTITFEPAGPTAQDVTEGNPATFGTVDTEDYFEVGCTDVTTTTATCEFNVSCSAGATPAVEMAGAISYFSCTFTNFDATEIAYIKYNQPTVASLAATIPVSQASLLKLGSLQNGTWVTDYDNTVSANPVTGMASVTTEVTTADVSTDDVYAKVVSNEMIYLPIVFRQQQATQ